MRILENLEVEKEATQEQKDIRILKDKVLILTVMVLVFSALTLSNYVILAFLK